MLECCLTENDWLCAGHAERYPSLPPPIELDHKDFYVVYPRRTELGLIWKVPWLDEREDGNFVLCSLCSDQRDRELHPRECMRCKRYIR